MENQLINKRLSIGIDLGTTNTTVCTSRVDYTGIVKIDERTISQKNCSSTDMKKRLPSVLHLDTSGNLTIGHEALYEIDKDIALGQTEVRYIQNSKLDIGTKKEYIIGDQVFTPSNVASEILKFVLTHTYFGADKMLNILSDYDVFISVPADFGMDAVNYTLAAAKEAGFVDPTIVYEPQAAILNFLHDQIIGNSDFSIDLTSKKRILVVDFGGGTCDICAEDVWIDENGKYNFQTAAVGRRNLGGSHIDADIARFLVVKYNIVSPTATQLASMVNSGRKLKEQLSNNIEDYVIEHGDINVYKDENWESILRNADSLEVDGFELTAAELIQIMKARVFKPNGIIPDNAEEFEQWMNVEYLISDTLQNHDIDASSIDFVFLTGGMSQCYIIKAALYEILKKDIIWTNQPFMEVSRGASLFNKYENIIQVPTYMMPQSIMLETASGHMSTLINMGERVPKKDVVPEIFHSISRSGVVIRLFEGKNEFDSNLRKLNSQFICEFEEPKAAGQQFTIEYDIDKTKRITFRLLFEDNSVYTIKAQV